MELTKEKIEELKKQHGKIFQTKLEFNNASKQQDSVEFVFRAPKVEDIERLQRTAQKSNAIANLELLSGIIVFPASKEIIDKLKDLPAVVGGFIQEEVLPFLGELRTQETTEL